ncbi:hypothetical protein FB567DRAFT_162614 [Paraphoma chrysanthemicola]|uniref:DUF3176 domain containing protein n=1 Tax=Paraphoma chrysanthemicola TaxID=798071 RepID=A0A8K0REJ2_9PLEO|nr:hypothetical protein FB567DRAFT_162614 [Paraphoma chrysanthemicola]
MECTCSQHHAIPSHSVANRASPPPSYRASVKAGDSLDITQRLERKLARYNASQSALKRWLFEIVSVTTSAICMAVIIVILVSLKDQPLSKWPLGLTIITVLSKIASAALILPISEAIGQLKWSWFHGKESKDAFDFEIFDKASRGAWGSVLLLIRTKGRSLAALGALLTVMLLAIDTFFQQVTDLPERWTRRGEGLIARAIRYEPEGVLAWQSNMGDLPLSQDNQDMKAALTPLFYDKNSTQTYTNRNGSEADFPVSCPTSVCEWSPYQTLGVCSECADISSLLSYACLPMKMDWIRSAKTTSQNHTFENGTACGYFLNATSAMPVLMSGYRVNNGSDSEYGETLLMRTLPLVTNPERELLYDGSINFKNRNHPILDAFIVSSADGSADSVYRKEKPIAHECALSWCVKTIHSSYSWGVYKENITDVFLNTTRGPHPFRTSYWALEDVTENDYYGNISIYPPNASRDGLGFGVSNDTNLDAIYIMDAVFPAVITVSTPTAQPFLKYRASFADRVMWRAFRFSPWIAPTNITFHMERIATALTNVARSDPGSNEFVAGQAFAPETYVKVNWGWLAFPLAMLALCLMFLVATIIKTSKGTNEELGTWKTSAMPTLIYSLPQHLRQDLTKASTWGSTAPQGPKNVKIRLMPDKGWRVSGQMCTSPTLHRRGSPRAPAGWI